MDACLPSAAFYILPPALQLTTQNPPSARPGKTRCHQSQLSHRDPPSRTRPCSVGAIELEAGNNPAAPSRPFPTKNQAEHRRRALAPALHRKDDACPGCGEIIGGDDKSSAELVLQRPAPANSRSRSDHHAGSADCPDSLRPQSHEPTHASRLPVSASPGNSAVSPPTRPVSIRLVACSLV
jgi:hypothetical protein